MTVNHWVTGSSPVRGANRSIAQSGSAPALGAGCREFESLYSDHFYRHLVMVGVAQLVELRIVIPAVVGSSPIVHPITTDSRAVSSVGRAVDF